MVQFISGFYGSPNGIATAYAEGADLKRFSAAGVLWLLVLWMFMSLLKHALYRTPLGRRVVAGANAEQRESFVMWIAELIVTIVSLDHRVDLLTLHRSSRQLQ
jgi:hypothetical protein